MTMTEDWDLWFRLLRHGYRFEPNENVVVAHRHDRAQPRRSAPSHHPPSGSTPSSSGPSSTTSLVVGRGAAAPLSRARSAHARAKRAAAVIGMQIIATGSLDPLDQLGGVRPRSTCRRCPRAGATTSSARRSMERAAALASPARPLNSCRLRRRTSSDGSAGPSPMKYSSRPYEPVNEPANYDATSRHQRADVVLAAESVADVQALLTLAATKATERASRRCRPRAGRRMQRRQRRLACGRNRRRSLSRRCQHDLRRSPRWPPARPPGRWSRICSARLDVPVSAATSSTCPADRQHCRATPRQLSKSRPSSG